MTKNSWDSSGKWYHQCVGEKGHYYHASLVLPKAKQLLQLSPRASLLDVGCGQGVWQRFLPKTIQYTGIDSSKVLIGEARKGSPHAHFLIADASKPYSLGFFDAVTFILSLQNMESPEQALEQASQHLNPNGSLLLVLNHPCFRIPRQSSWGIDESMHLQYRRINGYMTSQKIPIQTAPSQGKESAETITFHHPLSSYVSWLSSCGLAITAMEEWCSDKTSEGGKAKMENRARKEFPLFLAIVAKKGSIF